MIYHILIYGKSDIELLTISFLLLNSLQEPGKIESQITQVGTAEVLKNILANRKPGPSCFPEENAFGIDPENRVTLPSWFSEQDLSFYATKFNQTGFTGALNYYRAMNLLAPYN